MPIPPGFDNTVRHVSSTPVTASDINTELATQISAGYLCTNIMWADSANAFLLFVKNNAAAYGYDTTQKVNLVAGNQVDLDADKATEAALGYYPTGIFTTPGGDLLVLYAHLVIAD